MTFLRELRTSSDLGPIVLRYAVGGGTTLIVYLGMTLLLSGPVGLNIQIAIPIAYACALVVHFSMQRWFVWTHHDEYALGSRVQLVRYLTLAGAQYAVTAVATAVLPSVLDVSQQAVYVVTAVLVALLSFLVLRLFIFHPGEAPQSESDAA